MKVSQDDIDFAREQIEKFEQIEQGQWRYNDVEAWRGVVAEILASRWLSENFDVGEAATGLLPTGIEDEYDLIVNGRTVEIKSATKNYFRYIMPKIHDVINHPKDIYIGIKYNETIEPNEIQIIGFMSRDHILSYPIKKNKGAPYYEVPLAKLTPIEKLSF